MTYHALVSTQTREQPTTETLELGAAINFRHTDKTVQAVKDAAWRLRISMGELMRRFTDEGLAQLAGERNAAANTSSSESGTTRPTAVPPLANSRS
jgi:hypothetical protein